MESKNSKTSKSFLQALADNKKITPEGKDWLTAALDPFHDYEHQISGYPDADCSNTTVSCFQYQTVLAAPNGLAANWDAHVYNMPLCKTDVFELTDLDANWNGVIQRAPAAILFPTGPLTIMTCPSGGSFAPTAPIPPNTVWQALPAVDNTDLCSGITRIIGMGYEIVNTTSALHKQGTLTAYRMPQASSSYQMGFRNNGPGNFVAPVAGSMWRAPPASVASANLLKGTRTWEAAEGAYVTCFQNSVHNPMLQLESTQMMFNPAPTPTASPVLTTAINTVGPAAVAPSASTVAFEPNQPMPFDTTGVMLTGLSAESTLTIKLRVYVERAPTWAEPSLAVLASPSSGYDVRALELYAKIIGELPVAVKFGENAKGDWWRAVLRVAKGVAEPLGLALSPFVPGSAIVGKLVSNVAGQLDTSKGRSIAAQVRPATAKPASTALAKRKNTKLNNKK